MEKSILSVFLPNFSIEILKKTHGELPDRLILVDENEIVVRCNESARKAGITMGAHLADARARCADVGVFPFQSAAEQRVLQQLTRWGYQFSPAIVTDKPPSTEDPKRAERDPRFLGFNLDVTTTTSLLGGAEKILDTVSTELQHWGFSSRSAIAPTLGAAWALSRYGASAQHQATRTELNPQIASLPISALRLPHHILRSCAEVGIQSVADLLRLPRSALLSRFDSVVIMQLDAALGKREEPIAPQHPTRPAEFRFTFSQPVRDRAALKYALQILLPKFREEMLKQQKRPNTVGLRFIGTVAPHIERRVPLSLPTLETKHLERLLEKQIDLAALHTEIETLLLFAEHIESFRPEALTYLEEERRQAARSRSWALLRDRYRSTLGPDALCHLETSEESLPERSYRFVPTTNGTPTSALPPPTERPSVLFPIPEPLRVLAVVPDSPPFSLQWREQQYRVRLGIGPERISPPWWKEQKSHLARDYFQIQLETGTWLWIYREAGSGGWFLHGMWS